MTASSREKPLDSQDPISRIAAERFGVTYLRPIQRYVIAGVLDGRDQIVVLPTGAGKSLCFQLPAELLGGITLVVTPLLSLMEDQRRSLAQRGIRCAALRGGQSRGERSRLLREAAAGGLRLLYTTPETLRSLAAGGALSAVPLAHLVIDEAHCVVEWGETFRPSYLCVGEVAAAGRIPLVTAFTATASPSVLRRIRELVFAGRPVSRTLESPDRPNIRYEVVPALCKTQAALRIVRENPGCCVLFTMSRRGAEALARSLRRRLPSRRVRFYHAGLDREERLAVETWFLRSRSGVLAATSAYGLGVDKPDIRTVVHADLPPSVESYLQESGRAGRDGRPARAVLLVTDADRTRPSHAEARRAAADRYERMAEYAFNRSACRRRLLLALIDQPAVPCSGCDICLGRAELDAPEAPLLLELVRRHPRRLSLREAGLILGGGYSTTASQLLHERTPFFGLLRSWETEEIREALESLVRRGSLVSPSRGPWKGRLRTRFFPDDPLLLPARR